MTAHEFIKGGSLVCQIGLLVSWREETGWRLGIASRVLSNGLCVEATLSDGSTHRIPAGDTRYVIPMPTLRMPPAEVLASVGNAAWETLDAVRVSVLPFCKKTASVKKHAKRLQVGVHP